MAFETILVNVSPENVGNIVLNRPSRLNAMNPKFFEEFHQLGEMELEATWLPLRAVQRFDQDENVRVVVVSANVIDGVSVCKAHSVVGETFHRRVRSTGIWCSDG